MTAETADRRPSLSDWWLAQSQADLERTLPKIKEYSSRDLVVLGRVMAEMLGRREMNDAECAELGCFFYLLGKIARAAGAYQDHADPSDDTYFDIEIYAKMIRRIRNAGGWPNG